MAEKERITEFRFDLSSPLTYAYRGEQQSTEFIVLKEPTSKRRRDVLQLKQMFWRALPDMSDVDEDTKEQARAARLEKDSEAPDFGTGEEIMAMIARSRDVDLGDVVELGRTIFINGFATVGGEEPLKGEVADRIAWDDLEAMVGAYFENFILRSSSTRTKSS